MTDWKEITDPKELFSLDLSEWEIHRYHDRTEEWYDWRGGDWSSNQMFRARPRQPKMKKVKMLCYLVNGEYLRWITTGHAARDYVRQPHLDMEAEVPE